MTRRIAYLLLGALVATLIAACQAKDSQQDRPRSDMHSSENPNFERGGGGDHGGM